MSKGIQNYRDLIVWQKAMRLAKEVYQLSSGFPREERYGLTSQIRRAALSVPSNIAEGHARQGKEFRSFLSIARGSLAELEPQMLFSVEIGYVTSDRLQPLLSLADEIKRMCVVLAKRLAVAA